MRRVKKRMDSGCVCEQIVYPVPDNADIKTYKKRLRFKTEADRLAHKERISRANFIRMVNENHSPASLYSTLTFDDENELYSFKDARRIRAIYRRRLQRVNPSAKIIIVMGRGRSASRIHFHMISLGVTEEDVRKAWTWGSIVESKHLRKHNRYNGIDHGQDYTGLANYLFDHWTEEQGGHRYMATRNHKKPEAETPQEVKREYTVDKPPRAPIGYKLVEAKATSFGYLYYKYIKDPEQKEEGGCTGSRRNPRRCVKL